MIGTRCLTKWHKPKLVANLIIVFLLANVLSVLRFTDYDCPFVVFTHFFKLIQVVLVDARGTHLRPVHMTSWALVRLVQLTVHTVWQINEINVREHRNWQHRIHKTKTKKKTNNTICVRHHYAHANTNYVNKTWASYKQLEVKTKRCGNRNETRNVKIHNRTA
jgi:hypothetical protein